MSCSTGVIAYSALLNLVMGIPSFHQEILQTFLNLLRVYARVWAMAIPQIHFRESVKTLLQYLPLNLQQKGHA